MKKIITLYFCLLLTSVSAHECQFDISVKTTESDVSYRIRSIHTDQLIYTRINPSYDENLGEIRTVPLSKKEILSLCEIVKKVQQNPSFSHLACNGCPLYTIMMRNRAFGLTSNDVDSNRSSFLSKYHLNGFEDFIAFVDQKAPFSMQFPWRRYR